MNIIKNQIKKLIRKLVPLEIMPLVRHLSSRGKYISKNTMITDNLPPGKILVIAPHPDDEIIGMGGTFAKYLESGAVVNVLYLTDGRHDNPELNIPQDEMAVIRRKEAEAIGKKYSFNQVFWDIEDTCLTNDEATVSRMAGVIEDISPDVIFLPSFFDYHFDHFAANSLLAGSLKKLPGSGINILCYEVWDNIPYPDYIVDISSCFGKKEEMLSYYATPLKGIDYLKLCRHRNALHYARYINSKQEGYSEVFNNLDPVTYLELFDDYLNALKKYKSNLILHVTG